jgi:hypothetical protein
MLQTPILFIVFNRIDTVEKVFAKIKEAKPKELYIFCDGPRANKKGEDMAIQDVRKYVIDCADWGCDIKTNFQVQNLGPGHGVYSAIKWFFNQVEEGIVLEHDCLPHSDFFGYCDELLNKYRDNSKVSFITGNSFTNRYVNSANSYGFSALSHIWGWASWKRVIKDYHYEIALKDNEVISLIKKGKYFSSKYLTNYIRYMALLHRNKKINTWDIQLLFTIWQIGGLCIFPKLNLVSNIGFGKDAVHCLDENNPCANLPTFQILPLIHPLIIEIDYNNDMDYYKKYIDRNFLSYLLSILNYFLFRRN